MSNNEISFINSDNSKNFILSIRLAADGFSFYLSKRGEAEVHSFHYDVEPELSMPGNVARMMSRYDYLFALVYDSVNVLWCESRVSFVPFVLFDDDDAELVFRQNFDLPDGGRVGYNILARSGTVAVFDCDATLCGTFENKFGTGLRHLSPASYMAERFAALSRDVAGRAIYAVISEKRVWLFGMDGGKPFFVNSFDCREDADRAYFALAVWRSFGLDQKADCFYLVPDGAEVRPLEKLLSVYVDNVMLLPHDGRDMTVISDRRADKRGLPFDVESVLFEK